MQGIDISMVSSLCLNLPLNNDISRTTNLFVCVYLDLCVYLYIYTKDNLFEGWIGCNYPWHTTRQCYYNFAGGQLRVEECGLKSLKYI